jgi:hypothetical protein
MEDYHHHHKDVRTGFLIAIPFVTIRQPYVHRSIFA